MQTEISTSGTFEVPIIADQGLKRTYSLGNIFPLFVRANGASTVREQKLGFLKDGQDEIYLLYEQIDCQDRYFCNGHEVRWGDVHRLWGRVVARAERVLYLVDDPQAIISLYMYRLPGLLCSVEVEFSGLAGRQAFKPPGWMDDAREVTSDPRFQVGSIVCNGIPKLAVS